jgi:hypothetical protein
LGPVSGDDAIDAFGAYFPRSKGIVIDERFRPDKDAIRAGDKIEEAKLEVAYRLMIHEMIHQALYQQNAPKPGGHGSSFVDEARRIADQLEIKPPTDDDDRGRDQTYSKYRLFFRLRRALIAHAGRLDLGL